MSQALRYIVDRFFGHRIHAELEDARASSEVAELVRRLRVQAGLTQREVAQRVGTGASVICRLENDEYRGQGLAVLRRIAWALGKRVEVRIVDRHPTEAKT